jgi:hypothetical protein
MPVGKIARRWSKSVYKRLPAKPALGALEYYGSSYKLFYPWGFAMNGQTARLEVAREILEHLGIKAIIETGTYRGTTTHWLAQFGLPVLTTEINPRYHAFSKKRLSRFANVELYKSDSLTFLPTLKKRKELHEVPVFFYLDAHWHKHLPLREEIEMIMGLFSKPVIMIDDFKVPDDPAYGYDDYGPDKALTLEYIAPVSKGLAVYFPKTSAKWESGAKRGSVVLARDPEHIKKLEGFPLLRRWST